VPEFRPSGLSFGPTVRAPNEHMSGIRPQTLTATFTPILERPWPFGFPSPFPPAVITQVFCCPPIFFLPLGHRAFVRFPPWLAAEPVVASEPCDGFFFFPTQNPWSVIKFPTPVPPAFGPFFLLCKSPPDGSRLFASDVDFILSLCPFVGPAGFPSVFPCFFSILVPGLHLRIGDWFFFLASRASLRAVPELTYRAGLHQL